MGNGLEVEVWCYNENRTTKRSCWMFVVSVNGSDYNFYIPVISNLPTRQQRQNYWRSDWEAFIDLNLLGLVDNRHPSNGTWENPDATNCIARVPAVEFFSGTKWTFEGLPEANLTFHPDDLVDKDIEYWLNFLGLARDGLFKDSRIEYQVSRAKSYPFLIGRIERSKLSEYWNI